MGQRGGGHGKGRRCEKRFPSREGPTDAEKLARSVYNDWRAGRTGDVSWLRGKRRLKAMYIPKPCSRTDVQNGKAA